MKDRTRPLRDYRRTLAAINRLGIQYSADLGPMAMMGAPDFYRAVKALPYHADPAGVETVSRPAFTLRPDYAPRDCDDKAALWVAWGDANRVPIRLATVGQDTTFPHHVYPEAMLGGEWVPVDATFPDRGGMGERLYRETFRKVWISPHFFLML